MAFIGLETDQTVEYALQSEAANDLSFQLTGDHAPMIDIQLEPGQGIVCEMPLVMRSDAAIEIRNWPGVCEQIRLLVNSDEAGTAAITVMARCAGKAGVFDLSVHGGRLLCPQSAFLATGPGVMVSLTSDMSGLCNKRSVRF